ncbi:MAG: UDP-3-O-(3-hydroxymyristoyl)glucosamine N-acyltransferase, partial [Kiritimatiellia bacterium]|nr:UDP-3-O-(3-hydroxymyristoyl)glucosamine N-acyltransferase [Kiritimatiellia bacterium]
MTCTAQEIADAVGGDLEGDGRVVLSGIAGVREARPGDLTFVANPRYATDLASTRAGAALVARDWSKPAPCVLIRVDNPDHSFAQAAERFAPAPVQPQPGIHPSAVIAPDAVLGADVCIGPCCVLESGCRIGDRTVLFAGVYVGHQSAIGADGHIYPHVSIRERCRIGNRVILHNGVVLGSDGFGYSVDEKGVRHKIPQIGSVEIGDDVEIGANTTVDRARFGRTVIGNGVKIDNLVQIAHNVTVGDHSVIVSQSG